LKKYNINSVVFIKTLSSKIFLRNLKIAWYLMEILMGIENCVFNFTGLSSQNRKLA